MAEAGALIFKIMHGIIHVEEEMTTSPLYALVYVGPGDPLRTFAASCRCWERLSHKYDFEVRVPVPEKVIVDTITVGAGGGPSFPTYF